MVKVHYLRYDDSKQVFDLQYSKNFPSSSVLNQNYAVVRVFPFMCNLDDVELEQIYSDMQGERWSPNGEARFLIKSLNLQHTSMSVGDVVEDVVQNKFWIVRSCGFDEFSVEESGCSAVR